MEKTELVAALEKNRKSSNEKIFPDASEYPSRLDGVSSASSMGAHQRMLTCPLYIHFIYLLGELFLAYGWWPHHTLMLCYLVIHDVTFSPEDGVIRKFSRKRRNGAIFAEIGERLEGNMLWKGQSIAGINPS